jgi:hypothetical protein
MCVGGIRFLPLSLFFVLVVFLFLWFVWSSFPATLASFVSFLFVAPLLFFFSLYLFDVGACFLSFCGFLFVFTGFACMVEAPHRVNELMLYCVPQSLTICSALVARACTAGASNAENASFRAAVDATSVIVFALSAAVILGTPPGEMKGVLRPGLMWMLGPYA